MHLPPKELLEAHHSFPCTYTFKVIGQSFSGFFPQEVLRAVRQALPNGEEPAYSLRESKGKRHVSVTLEIKVNSADEVLLLYGVFLDLPGVAVVM